MSLPFINVFGETFGRAFNELLKKVYDEGVTSTKESYAYGKEKDLLFRECESRFEVKNLLKEPMFSRAMPGLPDFPDYIDDVLLGTKDYLIEKGAYTYTYHERIFTPAIKGGQLAEAIRKLGNHPYSNRAQLVTWQVPKDNLIESGQPCLQRIWFKVLFSPEENVLIMHTDWRSRDLFFAFSENIAGMVGIGKLMLDCLNDYYRLDIKRINYVDRCDSLHVYEKDAKEFENTVKLLRRKSENELLLDSKDPFLKRLWKGKEIFEGVERAKREIFDLIFKSNHAPSGI